MTASGAKDQTCQENHLGALRLVPKTNIYSHAVVKIYSLHLTSSRLVEVDAFVNGPDRWNKPSKHCFFYVCGENRVPRANSHKRGGNMHLFGIFKLGMRDL